MENSQVDYTIKFKDLVKTLISMVSGKESNEVQNEKDIEEKLKKIQKTEKELGATDEIKSLEKQLLEVDTKKSRKKSIEQKKSKTSVNSIKVDKITKSTKKSKEKSNDDKIQEI